MSPPRWSGSTGPSRHGCAVRTCLLLLLLGEAALTYSPRRVLWTGAWITGVWSLAFAVLYSLPGSVRYGDITAQGTDEGLLTLFLSPTYVSLPQWLVQIVS